MINRRLILAGAAALAFTASAASAQDWKTKYPELTFAVVPAENASGVTERWTPFVAYLSKELGVKVTLRIANDYAAVIEGQRAGNIHIASYGSASFARATFNASSPCAPFLGACAAPDLSAGCGGWYDACRGEGRADQVDSGG
jgi:phosphate/phosphite/phosphonate ABC transporter binding protein